MLDNRINSKLKLEKHSLVAKKTAPRLSLNLHTMPQTSNHHLKKWIFSATLLMLVFIVIAYFLFN